ncbi:uncharacterized protein LOC133331615 [Musca vetustissima]|uniref:uncharacterized protein LOC133331615 n=1 Tax=Musca vetustissima TaxID=27455 RepID=UPI002AB5FAF9|nr:uncharacterized protein LOC133331615 [Musca vetustissima]
MLIDERDMIEINLNSSSMGSTLLHETPCLTKSFSITDLKDRALHSRIKPQPKYATIGGVKGSSSLANGKQLDSPNISCLRQMYCPDCKQRLDKESVRFESLLTCCLPLFPLTTVYKCCLKRSVGRKVICNKCGSNLGYWKRS